MPLPLLLAAGGASLAGGIANYFANMSAADRAEAIRDKGLQDLLAIQIPDPAKQRLALQRFAQTGELAPEFQQAIKQAPSEFQKITADMGQKAAQNRALMQLQQVGSEGGLRLQDKAALQDAQMQAQVQDRGARQAIQDDMARRGQGGSGFAMQAQLQGQQAAGDRAAKSALSVAGSAQDRALQAIMQGGEMATKMRGQDFSEQSAKAQAADAINRFNTQNLQDVMNSNVGIANSAQKYNLGEKQRIADANVKTSNDEQRYNKELLQQQYENQMNMAKAKNSIYGGQAQGELARGQAQGNLWSNLGSAAAGGLGAINEQSNWDDYFDGQKKRKGTGGFGQ